jgi:hypothetical protein
LQLEIEGSVEPESDREGLGRAALERQLMKEKWQSLRKSARDAITLAQIELTPGERAEGVRRLYFAGERLFLSERQSGGVKTEGSRVYLQLR